MAITSDPNKKITQFTLSSYWKTIHSVKIDEKSATMFVNMNKAFDKVSNALTASFDYGKSIFRKSLKFLQFTEVDEGNLADKMVSLLFYQKHESTLLFQMALRLYIGFSDST